MGEAKLTCCRSFLAGELPLSMTLSQSQLRLISSIGVGVLVGTSLIVIIPEGIEAASSPSEASHLKTRSLLRRVPVGLANEARMILDQATSIRTSSQLPNAKYINDAVRRATDTSDITILSTRAEPHKDNDAPGTDGTDEPPKNKEESHDDEKAHKEHAEIPTLEIGLSMTLGFILMFLIDRLPRHAAENMQHVEQTQHISMDNLAGGDTASVDLEAESFLGSLAPTQRHARSFATTIGLVIHAAADGIAMGASATTSNMKLGFVIFIAIMIHKAPAAFGLTSVLLKQGLSKRAARGHLVIFSLAAPAGALSTWVLVTILGGGKVDDDAGLWWTGMLLLFSGGTFLYVAMHAMQESGSHSHDATGSNGYAEGPTQRKPDGPSVRDTLATTGGMLLPLLTQFGHHH